MSAFSAQILIVKTPTQYQQARQLIEEYATLRNFDAALAGIHAELDKLADYYPLMLLAYCQDQPAGCVAIQALEEGICEMKRMFVSPAFRNLGIGHQLIQTIIAEAKALGFKYMRLDTHPKMITAQKLYRSFGFIEIERYNQNPIPGIRFFELQLANPV